MKARQNLGIKRQNSSSRREIIVPDRPDLKTPMVMSAANPLGLGKRPPSNTRQKTTLNSDLPSDLLSKDTMLKSGTSKGVSKGAMGLGQHQKARLPMPPKRGNSLGPGRMKTSSAADLAGIKAHIGISRETPSGTADSTTFSQKSNKTGMAKAMASDAHLDRP